MKIFAGLMILIAGCAGLNADEREWTSTTGSTLKAELVSFRWKTIKLKSKSGKEVEIPIEKLSEKDQKYLKTVGPVVVISGDGLLAQSQLGNGLKHFSEEGIPEIQWIHPEGSKGVQESPIRLQLDERGKAIQEAMKIGKEKGVRRFFVFSFLFDVPFQNHKVGPEVAQIREFMPLCVEFGYTPVLMVPYPKKGDEAGSLKRIEAIMAESKNHPSMVVVDSLKIAEALSKSVSFWDGAAYFKKDEDYFHQQAWRSMLSGRPGQLSKSGKSIFREEGKPVQGMSVKWVRMSRSQFEQTAKVIHENVPK